MIPIHLPLTAWLDNSCSWKIPYPLNHSWKHPQRSKQKLALAVVCLPQAKALLKCTFARCLIVKENSNDLNILSATCAPIRWSDRLPVLYLVATNLSLVLIIYRSTSKLIKGGKCVLMEEQWNLLSLDLETPTLLSMLLATTKTKTTWKWWTWTGMRAMSVALAVSYLELVFISLWISICFYRLHATAIAPWLFFLLKSHCSVVQFIWLSFLALWVFSFICPSSV